MSSSPITDAGLDAAEITKRVDAVLADPLYWFPVRHHSPTTARHVQSAITARKPKVVFIEGPFESNHLIKFVTDGATAPPVAIYSSYRDDASASTRLLKSIVPWPSGTNTPSPTAWA